MAFCFSAVSTSVCSWAAVYGNGLCSKITKQTNNIAIEVTKHCLELRAPESCSGTVCKTSQSKPSGNGPLQNFFLRRSVHTSAWEEAAGCGTVAGNPKRSDPLTHFCLPVATRLSR